MSNSSAITRRKGKKGPRKPASLRQVDLQGVLDAIPGSIAILDNEARIICTNRSWRSFGEENGSPDFAAGPGVSYLDACDNATGPDSAYGHRFAACLREMLYGVRDSFQMDYPCRTPESSRWFSVSASSCRTGPRPFHVVAHIDINHRMQSRQGLVDHVHLLSKEIREKDAVIRKIRHRTRNSLQLILSIMNLQAEELQGSARAGAFEELRDRVHAVSLMQEKLIKAESDGGLNIGRYLRDLFQYLRNANPGLFSGLHLSKSLGDVEVTMGSAVPLGLIVSEFAGHALRHSLRDVARKEIGVALARMPERKVCLEFRDNGPRPADPAAAWESNPLGLRLVNMLVQQLGGRLAAKSSEAGNVFRLELPEEVCGDLSNATDAG